MDDKSLNIIIKAFENSDLTIINDVYYLEKIKYLLTFGYIIDYHLVVKIINTNQNLTNSIFEHNNAKCNYMLDACYYGDFDMIKLMIKNGINIHYESDNALKSMINHKQYDNALYLIEIGANINELCDYEKNIIFEYCRKVKLSKIINE